MTMTLHTARLTSFGCAAGGSLALAAPARLEVVR
jgi:hypothetical protein